MEENKENSLNGLNGDLNPSKALIGANANEGEGQGDHLLRPDVDKTDTTANTDSSNKENIDNEPFSKTIKKEAEKSVEESKKVKPLPPVILKEIEQKNQARKLANLPLLAIKVRRCIACKQLFESAGKWNCGCQSKTTGSISGRDVLYNM